MYKPYTYCLSWSQHDKHYYGVRYSKDIEGVLAEEDIWVQYFTSSEIVHAFREKFGEPDKIQIRRTFDDAKSAQIWEDKVLRRLKVLTNDRWLNNNYGLSDNWSMKGRKHSSETIKKMSIVKKGKKHSSETRKKMSLAHKGKKKTPEHVLKVAEANRGLKRSESTKQKMSKWVRTEEARKKMSLAQKGKKQPEEVRKKRGEKLKQYWADVKAGKIDRPKIKHSEESRKKRSERVKQYWADVKAGKIQR